MPRGVVAAGHQATAQAGADVLGAGGNAVDAAIAAVLVSLTAEPGLTALGGGGYMLVAEPSGEAALLDFFVEAPGRGADASLRGELVPIAVDFGDVTQMFNAGPASVGCYGLPAGMDEAARRYGSMPLAELTAPAAARARAGIALNSHQAYVLGLLESILVSTPECAAVFAPAGELLAADGLVRQPELADALELLGREGSRPFYEGEVADAITTWLSERGGMLTAEDLRSYVAVARRPVGVGYREREVLSNPPPSAGGILIADVLRRLGAAPSPPSPGALVEAMAAAQERRTPEFHEGLADEGFAERFAAGGSGPTSGSTTHISTMDADGMACGVTCSNGEGSGIVVPGTGIHLNNMLGEHDLNPLGFHRHPPGRRMPSMMAPTVVMAGGRPELMVGSGGSNRIRSAIVQTLLGVVDAGRDVQSAVDAPRLHFEDGVVYAEPGADLSGLHAGERAISGFAQRSMFFGGVQAVHRDTRTGELSAAADPRRGGAVVVVD